MKTLTLFLLMVGGLNAADIEILKEETGPHARYRRMVGKMDRKTFVDMARTFLDSEEVKVGVLALYGSNWESVATGPGYASSSSYDMVEGLLRRYDIDRSGCPEVKQAVKFGSAMLYRAMNRDCRNEEMLLKGSSSPLEMTVNGERVELLEFYFAHPMGVGNDHNVHVEFFARTSGLVTAEHAKSVTARIAELTGLRMMFVGLRRDTWFFNSGIFPQLFPWEGRPKMPSVEQFRRAREAHCGVFDFGKERITCRAYGGAGAAVGPATQSKPDN